MPLLAKLRTEKLDLRIVDHFMERIKYKYIDGHSVKLRQRALIEYCYNFKDKFLPRNTSLEEMRWRYRHYVYNRKKGGVVAITKRNNVLLVLSYGLLCLPKGKQDFYDANIEETAIRELKEETGIVFL